MEVMVIVCLVALTSAGGYLVGRSLLGLSRSRLGGAFRQMLECCGVSLAFAVANLAIGAAVIVIFRETTGTFLSLYLLDDVTLILASALQGIVFFCWGQLSVSLRAPRADSPTRDQSA